jgi:hypothetical protein
MLQSRHAWTWHSHHAASQWPAHTPPLP